MNGISVIIKETLHRSILSLRTNDLQPKEQWQLQGFYFVLQTLPFYKFHQKI